MPNPSNENSPGNSVDLENRFTEPTPENVEVGDLLVGGNKYLVVMPIIKVEGDKIIARSGVWGDNVPYSRAIVLKKDKTYLVGKDVYGTSFL